MKRRAVDEQEVKKSGGGPSEARGKDKNVEKKESAAEQAHVRTKLDADQPIVNVETATEKNGVKHCLLNPTQRYPRSSSPCHRGQGEDGHHVILRGGVAPERRSLSRK